MTNTISETWETVELPAPQAAKPGWHWVKTLAHIRDNTIRSEFHEHGFD